MKHSARFLRLTALLLALLSSLSFAGCAFSLSFESGGQNGTADGGVTVSDPLSGVTPLPYEDTLAYHYYRQLNDTERALYTVILEKITLGTASFTVENTDYETVKAMVSRVSTAVYYDHPERFWLAPSYQISGSLGHGEKDDSVTVTWETCNFADAGTREEQRTAIESAVSSLVTEASGYATDYEKAKFVHDALASKIFYDKKNSDKFNGELNSVYCALVWGQAVCGGYARAFQMVMNRLGIPCTTVHGTAEGGPHAWNAVTLDGETCYIDLTWNDGEDGATHHYFGLTSEELAKTHTADPEFAAPTASSEANHYYRREGKFLDTYSFEGVSEVLEKQRGTDGCIKFASEAELDRALKELFEDDRWQELPVFEGATRLSYSLDREHCTIYLTVP